MENLQGQGQKLLLDGLAIIRNYLKNKLIKNKKGE